jgi:hypothetical protein
MSAGSGNADANPSRADGFVAGSREGGLRSRVRVLLVSLWVWALLAPGSGIAQLAPPAAPADPASARFTLGDVWDRLTTGAPGTKRGSGFVGPVAGPDRSATRTTDELMAVAPAADNSGGAAAADVLARRKFWGLRVRDGVWGLHAGTMPDRGAVTIQPGAAAQPIEAGYHDGSGTVEGDADLTAANIRAGVSIFGVVGSVIEAAGNAVAAEVRAGKTFSNANLAGITGTMAFRGGMTITPGSMPQTITTGYHDGSGSVVGDPDLVAASLRSGVSLFGVVGTYPVAGVQKTGEVDCWKLSGSDWVEDKGCVTNAPAGQDGKLRMGVSFPSPRFTKNGNGTVTDNLTGLIWLEDPDCFGMLKWYDAMMAAYNLKSGDCGLTDGSTQGSWRLPNANEMLSLVHEGLTSGKVPDTAGTDYAKPGDPFTTTPREKRWTSSSERSWANENLVPCVSLSTAGIFSYCDRSGDYAHAWPVRGGP